MREGFKNHTHRQHVIDKFDIKSYTGTVAPSINFWTFRWTQAKLDEPITDTFIS